MCVQLQLNASHDHIINTPEEAHRVRWALTNIMLWDNPIFSHIRTLFEKLSTSFFNLWYRTTGKKYSQNDDDLTLYPNMPNTNHLDKSIHELEAFTQQALQDTQNQLTKKQKEVLKIINQQATRSFALNTIAVGSSLPLAYALYKMQPNVTARMTGLELPILFKLLQGVSPMLIPISALIVGAIAWWKIKGLLQYPFKVELRKKREEMKAIAAAQHKATQDTLERYINYTNGTLRTMHENVQTVVQLLQQTEQKLQAEITTAQEENQAKMTKMENTVTKNLQGLGGYLTHMSDDIRDLSENQVALREQLRHILPQVTNTLMMLREMEARTKKDLEFFQKQRVLVRKTSRRNIFGRKKGKGKKDTPQTSQTTTNPLELPSSEATHSSVPVFPLPPLDSPHCYVEDDSVEEHNNVI